MHLQCYSEPILYSPGTLFVHFSLHQHCAMHLGKHLGGFLCTVVQGEKCMAAVVLGCRKPWFVLAVAGDLLISINGLRKCSSHLSISGSVAS